MVMYSHTLSAAKKSAPPSSPSIALPAIRMAMTISTKAANSLVLKNCLVSVLSRRAVCPARLRAPVDPVVASRAAMEELLTLDVRVQNSGAGPLSRSALRVGKRSQRLT